MSEPVIQSLLARRVWDSRGHPTLEAEIALTDGAIGRAIAPAGASRGSREAAEKRDGGAKLGGLDVQSALAGVRAEIAPALAGASPFAQAALDQKLAELDGTDDFSRLGGNSVTAVSLAALNAAAASRRLPFGAISREMGPCSSRCRKSRFLAAAHTPRGAPTCRTS